MSRGTPQHDRTRLARRAAREPYQFIFANHNLVDEVAGAQLRQIRPVEGRRDLGAEHGGQALRALKVRMFYRHDASLREDLFGVVVDELAVDKTINTVDADLGA